MPFQMPHAIGEAHRRQDGAEFYLPDPPPSITYPSPPNMNETELRKWKNLRIELYQAEQIDKYQLSAPNNTKKNYELARSFWWQVAARDPTAKDSYQFNHERRRQSDGDHGEGILEIIQNHPMRIYDLEKSSANRTAAEMHLTPPPRRSMRLNDFHQSLHSEPKEPSFSSQGRMGQTQTPVQLNRRVAVASAPAGAFRTNPVSTPTPVSRPGHTSEAVSVPSDVHSADLASTMRPPVHPQPLINEVGFHIPATQPAQVYPSRQSQFPPPPQEVVPVDDVLSMRMVQPRWNEPFPAYPPPDYYAVHARERPQDEGDRALFPRPEAVKMRAQQHRHGLYLPFHVVFKYWGRDLSAHANTQTVLLPGSSVSMRRVVPLPCLILPDGRHFMLFVSDHHDLTDRGWGAGIKVHDNFRSHLARLESEAVEISIRAIDWEIKPYQMALERILRCRSFRR